MEKIKEMSIDLETYSDRDIKKCGVYKYAESDAFEILLFAVSINGGEVIVYDLACGDILPAEIIDALVDDTVTKWAYNASLLHYIWYSAQPTSLPSHRSSDLPDAHRPFHHPTV